MYGWIPGDTSAEVKAGRVPYWDSAHSIMRTLTVSGASLVQLPAAGTFEPLRVRPQPLVAGPVDVVPGKTGFLPTIVGDALEIIARFATAGVGAPAATSFGLALRVLHSGHGTFSCNVGYSVATKSLSAPGIASWGADIIPQPTPGTWAEHPHAHGSCSASIGHSRGYGWPPLLGSSIVQRWSVSIFKPHGFGWVNPGARPDRPRP